MVADSLWSQVSLESSSQPPSPFFKHPALLSSQHSFGARLHICSAKRLRSVQNSRTGSKVGVCFRSLQVEQELQEDAGDAYALSDVLREIACAIQVHGVRCLNPPTDHN